MLPETFHNVARRVVAMLLRLSIGLHFAILLISLLCWTGVGVHTLVAPDPFRFEAGEHSHQKLQQVPGRSSVYINLIAYLSVLSVLLASNIFLNKYDARRCEVKVIDFGSSCYIHDVLSSYVQSRSYRAPEV